MRTVVRPMPDEVETDRLGEMQQEGLNVLYNVIGPERDSFIALANGINKDMPISYAGTAGLATTDDTMVDPRSVIGSGVVGNTLYGQLAIALYDHQIHISQLESDAAASVVAVERGCSGPAKPTP